MHDLSAGASARDARYKQRPNGEMEAGALHCGSDASAQSTHGADTHLQLAAAVLITRFRIQDRKNSEPRRYATVGEAVLSGRLAIREQHPDSPD